MMNKVQNISHRCTKFLNVTMCDLKDLKWHARLIYFWSELQIWEKIFNSSLLLLQWKSSGSSQFLFLYLVLHLSGTIRIADRKNKLGFSGRTDREGRTGFPLPATQYYFRSLLLSFSHAYQTLWKLSKWH